MLNGIKNKNREILCTNEHGKKIVWENEDYFIVFSHGDRRNYYISLWNKETGKTVGELYANVDTKSGIPD
jgi:hypothetical protein